MARTAPPPQTIARVKTGRPPIYDQSFPDLAHKFCLLGATNEKLGELFGVATMTIEHWLRVHPEFFRAVHEGRDLADAHVAHALYHRAKGYTHKAVKIFCNPTTGQQEIIEYTEHYPPDVRAAQYWLNNRRRNQGDWNSTERRELSGPGGESLFLADAHAKAARDALRAELLSEGTE